MPGNDPQPTITMRGNLETMEYDSNVLRGVMVRRDLHGLILVTGDTLHVLEDSVQEAPALTVVERTVLAARLRAWATQLEQAPDA